MNPQIVRGGLRAVAILIAVAGVIDPAWTISRPQPPRLVAVRMTSTPNAAVEQSLGAALAGWNIEFRGGAARLPCDPDERCVAIADGSTDGDVPDDLRRPLSVIAIRDDQPPNIALRSVTVSRAHQAAAGTARVEMSRSGDGPKETEIRIVDGGAIVGSARYQWTAVTTGTIDVAWLPIDVGARALRIEAVPFDGEKNLVDNQIDAGAIVETGRSPVLVFDARPSWSSTFVRRALEDDPRFSVNYRARLAPALTSGTANGRLDTASLDQASVVVIGGPDALTSAETALLEQFVSVRGGTLILLPERAPAGPSASLFFGRWSEHLTSTVEPVGQLRASETLRLDSSPSAATVIARSGSSSIVVAQPTGAGRVVVAGAMDAWRYRDADAGAFDRFWRSLAAEGAAVGSAVQASFDRDLAAPGARVRFTVRERRMTPAAAFEATAIARCGDGAATAIRLWPAGQRGVFAADVPMSPGTACTVEATVNDQRAVASIALTDHAARGVDANLSALERQARASGGVAARAGDASLAAALNTFVPETSPIVSRRHPLRAPLWILPFAGCLSIEWWLRRRHGLR